MWKLKRPVWYPTAILHSTQVACQTVVLSDQQKLATPYTFEENVCKGGKKDVWSINGGEMDRGCRKNRRLCALYGSTNFFRHCISAWSLSAVESTRGAMGLSFVAKLVKMLWETKITKDPSTYIGQQTFRITRRTCKSSELHTSCRCPMH